MDGRTMGSRTRNQHIECVLRENRFSLLSGETGDISTKVDAMIEFLEDARYIDYLHKLSDDSIGCAYSLLKRTFVDTRDVVRSQERFPPESLAERLPAIVQAANRLDPPKHGSSEPDIHCLERFLVNTGLAEVADVLTVETLAWAWVLLRNIRRDLGITR